jgi:hypothetical protein
MSWDAAGAVAAQRLAELAHSAPPRWARAIVPPQLDARGTTVLYAPAWERPETWQPVLRTWAATLTANDDVTLVLAAPTGQGETLAPQALACLHTSGRAPEALPDVLLDDPPSDRLDGLVGRCDAVLLDAATRAGSTYEALTRRALRTLAAEPAALAAFAAHLRETPRSARSLAA